MQRTAATGSFALGSGNNRANSAYIDIPGPYEKGLPATDYISPPDPSWTAAEQRDYLPGQADLLFTSVREVWPGHFLQFLHSNRNPSLIGRLFVGSAFAEGWAHYSASSPMPCCETSGFSRPSGCTPRA